MISNNLELPKHHLRVFNARMPQDEVNRRSQNTIRLSSCVFVKPSSRGAACANQSVSRSLSSATSSCLEILQSISLTGGFLDYGGFLEFSLFWSKTFVSFLFFAFSFEYCTIAQMSNSNCSKKLATFESGGSALIKHFSLKRATYYLDQFSSFLEKSGLLFLKMITHIY